MSTSDPISFEVGPCPCGAGKIIQSFTCEDISFEIFCLPCSRDWRVYGAILYDAKSDDRNEAAQAEEAAKRDAHMALCDQLVNSYFSEFAAKTEKAAYAEMVRLNLYRKDYSEFLADRRENKSYLPMVFGGPPYDRLLVRLAKRAGVLDELRRLDKEHDEAAERAVEAYEAIITRPIQSALLSPLNFIEL